ncbi:MAG: iron-sulfur cluster assembly scaffold protein [Chloroflexota bacterium]|nr:MAG: iron-sulfur cluster assembly scaffold protein [Chloroflexota bacterium]
MLSRQDYIENILDHHDYPRNKRVLKPTDIEVSGGNPGCGDIVVMYLRLDGDDRVAEASFQGEGCTISLAAASMLTEDVVGKTLDEVRQMSFEDIIDAMGKEVVSTRTRCATLALTLVKGGSEKYQRDQRQLRIDAEDRESIRSR